MKFLSVILLAVLMSGCASSSDEQASNDGLICKREKPTGSNIPTRVCRTPEQIAAMEKESKEGIRDIQRNSTNTVRMN
ncbi:MULTISPECIES: hypothetical protein [unclassified Pseudoalteromonas]|uniref:hypothetical protein n=1 Tax=unclassified Pseudoalteromonas TaxID=194690 RepID=UPI001881141D|nr:MULTISPECIES: hypothetical protein [Gammaproteobacteria]MCF7518647.1 hypothetical protein [Pseudoalteromonas sp. L21]UJX26509.1 hypothetical protein L3Q70_04950 [Pseudoalteromonas sp. CF6-2]|tara:strand:+ start:5810 stop:6043 length:234 start_codon:yes stop_codon:yes gene_type:complete